MFTARDKKVSPSSVSEAIVQADGNFPDLIGTPSAPVLVGSWDINGDVIVTAYGKTLKHPLSLKTKNWKGKLVIEKASPTQVSGHWIVNGWKWTAHRVAKGKTCAGI